MTPEPHKQEVKKETSIYANQHHSNVYTVNYYFIFSILIKTYPVTLVNNNIKTPRLMLSFLLQLLMIHIPVKHLYT